MKLKKILKYVPANQSFALFYAKDYYDNYHEVYNSHEFVSFINDFLPKYLKCEVAYIRSEQNTIYVYLVKGSLEGLYNE